MTSHHRKSSTFYEDLDSSGCLYETNVVRLVFLVMFSDLINMISDAHFQHYLKLCEDD